MLLQRIAKNNIKIKINVLLDKEKFDKLPQNLAVKKIAKYPSKNELIKDLEFYAKYGLTETANLDEKFSLLLKEILKIIKKKEYSQLEEIVKKLK